jgi:hypothetical protein
MMNVMTACNYIQCVIDYIRESCYEYQELPELDYPNLCDLEPQVNTNSCSISTSTVPCTITITEL